MADRKTAKLAFSCVLGAMAACTGGGTKPPPPVNHPYFPITSGVHAVDCTTCHTASADGGGFAQFTCLSCHNTDSGIPAHVQPSTDPLHLGITDGGYAYDSNACYRCHNPPNHLNFDHQGIAASGAACRTCHFVDTEFFALTGSATSPILPDGGVHQPVIGSQDCGSCHNTITWVTDGGAPGGLVHDANQNITVNALIPTYAFTSISMFSGQPETLYMDMSHTSAQVPAAAMSACSNCHQSGSLYPGVFHSSLDMIGVPQPAQCSDCHASAMPTGFVGPMITDGSRFPQSGEMKHDAVAWVNNARTGPSVVPASCEVCHQSPGGASLATWQLNNSDSGMPDAGTLPVLFHYSLSASHLAEPSSCVDCHANSRPGLGSAKWPAGVVTLLTGTTFDHTVASALSDCGTCHTSSTVQWASWAGGIYHAAGSATPSTCLPCHAGERPTTTTGWKSTTYQVSPFDYTTNHGDGQDCATCHNGPGTGAWGGTQNWVGGNFTHGTTTISGTSCIACHATQRPDLQAGTTAAAMAALLGFDHSLSGTGDCLGCHQATVTANKYVLYPVPLTTKNSSDWQNGQLYPANNLIASNSQFIDENEITLNRSGTLNLVTSMSSSTVRIYNSMLHTSAQIHSGLDAGLVGDLTVCWHCHTNTLNTGCIPSASNPCVSAFQNGQFHPALTTYCATPGNPPTNCSQLPQPTQGCTDCHVNMRPAGIVEMRDGGTAPFDPQPMDHSEALAQVDCSTCHKNPGVTWTDGQYHSHIGASKPADCTVCHYPLMADTAKSDLSSTASYGYAMKHSSVQLTFQNCQTCHNVLGVATTGLSSTLWKPGAYHASLATQPSACVDCHTPSEPGVTFPPLSASTQSSWIYLFVNGGGTGTGATGNGPQYMNHGSSFVSGKDCVVCHAADAQVANATWSKADTFHTNVTNPNTCTTCHGLSNGMGGTDGVSNNLPSGLTNTTMVTTAAGDLTTGVPAGTLDQIDHSDVNVTNHNCNFCHTQAGISSNSGIHGKEWAQASFHVNFNTANPLAMNGTTGRCSNCHFNVRPHAGFSTDHSTYTQTSTTDCATCHTWPGTGTSATPNWLGAVGGAPSTINVGGFAISVPPETSVGVIQQGITSLPHPATDGGIACGACHLGGVGGKNAIGYDHASTLISTNCDSCHESGSNLIDAGLGVVASQADTRPMGLTNLGSSDHSSQLICGDAGSNCMAQHWYVSMNNTDCSMCHQAPGMGGGGRGGGGTPVLATATGSNGYCPLGSTYSCGGSCAPSAYPVCCSGGGGGGNGNDACPANTTCCGGGQRTITLPDGGTQRIQIPSTCCPPGVTDPDAGSPRASTSNMAWTFHHPSQNTQLPMCCTCHSPPNCRG